LFRVNSQPLFYDTIPASPGARPDVDFTVFSHSLPRCFTDIWHDVFMREPQQTAAPSRNSALIFQPPRAVSLRVRAARPIDLAGLTAVIAVGAGFYGATLGIWRGAGQAAYSGVKFPLIILGTVLINALLNWIAAQIIGMNCSLRQSLATILFSFAVTAAVLGSLSPVMLFLAVNTPELGSSAEVFGHSVVLLLHVAVIALAGIQGTVRMYRVLQEDNNRQAKRLLLTWLSLNMFVGCQLSWNLRPFIGSPGLPIEFIRGDAFRGTFYEAVFRAVNNL
jgi:hypothetical protein